jgi:hypothetical protein
MATTTCPSCGAKSATSDYCDSCGAALTAAPAAVTDPVATVGPATAQAAGDCPNCGAVRTTDDAFCEVCGLDFASGQMPVAPAPQPASAQGPPSGWTAVIEADQAFFDNNVIDSPAGLAFPNAASREVALDGDEIEIGRRSEAKGYFPAIDLSAPFADPGVSHHHAVLRRQPDNSWSLVDERSTNGTYLNGETTPVEHGVVTAIHDGDRINLGSFTRITFVRTKVASGKAAKAKS